MDIPQLQPGCPWYELSSWALPNVKWCEASRCAWVVEPANTWSNLAYVFIGLAIFIWGRTGSRQTARIFAYNLIFVGIASGIYHASYTFFFQLGDFIAMYALLFVLLVLNLKRAVNLRQAMMFAFWLIAVVCFTALTILFHKTGIPIQILVVLIIISIFVSEVWINFKWKHKIDYSYYYPGWALLAVAFIFSILDVTRTMCYPYHPILQGHALWHVLSALSILALYFFYSQFEEA